ncbi:MULTISPECIES: hypothetical protein [unclassified Exiguobacterium]|nr:MULTISPECIES: hypothetical protein [unclassified Exiguobacterium]ASI36380.1 hypothetical protein A0126_12555 [Exiguobacterium sp. N4-1P]
MKRLLLLVPFFLIGCTSDPTTQIQDELDNNQYTKAVDLSTDQDEMNEPARLMVQLEQALASYRLQDVVTISKKIEQLNLPDDHTVRERAVSIRLGVDALLQDLSRLEATYRVDRSLLDTGVSEEKFDGQGDIEIRFDDEHSLIATFLYDDFGMKEAPRQGTDEIRFEPDLTARVPLSEGVISYRFIRTTLKITYEGPGGKRIYYLKQLKDDA